jgi:23S rRNA pseudouridine955/2504/2580 synthase
MDYERICIVKADLRVIQVKQDDDGQRLDRWIKKYVPDMPYILAQKLLRKGQIRVDGKRAKPDTRLVGGQEVKIPPYNLSSENKEPQKRKLSAADAEFIHSLVIHDDGDVVVLNKPHGIATQGGTGQKRHIDGMLEALKNREGVVPRLVHRLDKDTSGVLLLARSAKVARELGDAFKGRDVRKTYWAIVSPCPEAFEGTIKAPIMKAGGMGKEKMVIDEEEGKFAVTEYAVVEHADREAAFVAFWPRTGRTHQIRIHAQVMGCSILGDGKYKAVKDAESKRIDADLADMELSKRLHLHARRIIMKHPTKHGKVLDITAPLPPELVKSWRALGFNPKHKQDPFADLE